MALPTKSEVDDLVSSLNEVAQAYSDAPDLDGYMSRVQILDKARKLTQALITPDQKPNYHGLNVSSVMSRLSPGMVSCSTATHVSHCRWPNSLLFEHL
jgi:hypothetical protein